MITHIKVIDQFGEETTLPVGQVDPEVIETLTQCVYVNSKNNFEISNESVQDTESKVNIVSKTDIQVKPGDDGAIQLDCEKNVENGDPAELSIKVCNGAYKKTNRVVGTKMNVAEVTFDNQKTHSQQVDNEETFDIDKIRINFRTDKWKNDTDNTPTRKGKVGPVDVKFRGKSFDIRCHGNKPGGGIALQPSGSDSNGFENKIKFESSRISELNDTADYTTEGGKGLEFGTFNNEHTSIYTNDYRFNANGVVYAVTRGNIETSQDTGKVDYPTQGDDFKDIPLTQEGSECTYDNTNGWVAPQGETIISCTWEDIINAALYFKSLSNQ